ncbi:Ger(x)C family spore germination protein [Clostridium intestinale]|uniref:Germination protein, Ger(X)C family n=1 Tax=Clostridium intestinale DSM 6191 TaxID=1121320 RepID=A0A1M6C6N0_9CLOT|nr:Ger(x)C family spore germination protein [Clostridium intestinale]SHI56642.1 germination protein, Ger(x)C family [Clostridium intestinale DSM 6191]
MKTIKVVSILILTSLLSGCWDKAEIEDIGYVAVIGIDDAGFNNISVTFQVTNPQVGTSAKVKVDEPATNIITLLSKDLITAREISSMSIARRLTFAHVKAVVVSEEFAKTDKLFTLIEAAQRDRDIRRDFDFIICKEKASEFIRKNDPQFDTRVAKYYDFVSSRWKDSGYVPLSDLHRLSQRTSDDLGLFLGTYATTNKENEKKFAENETDYIAGEIPEQEPNPTQMMGSAVFRKGKMIGTLTGDETRLALILRPKIITNHLIISFPDPMKEEERVTTMMFRGKNKIKIDVTNEHPVINVTVPLKLSITAIPSLIDYVENQENQRILEQSIKEYLEDKATKLVKKTQEEFHGEPFNWSIVVRKEFRLYDDLENYNWMDKYTDAEVNIKFDVKIKDFGKHIAPTNLKRPEN